MDCITPGLLPELTQTHVHWVGGAIQPSHPLLSPSPSPSIFPASGSFPVSQFLRSGGQSIGVSWGSLWYPKTWVWRKTQKFKSYMRGKKKKTVAGHREVKERVNSPEMLSFLLAWATVSRGDDSYSLGQGTQVDEYIWKSGVWIQYWIYWLHGVLF